MGYTFSQKQDSVELKKAEKDLILLVAVEPLINLKKNKGSIFPLENDKQAQPIQIYLKHIACHGEYLAALKKKQQQLLYVRKDGLFR